MRFGFKTAPKTTDWASIAQFWRVADQIPLFESGWMSDHLMPRSPQASRLEGWLCLAGVANVTERLRLGTLVTGVHARHPFMLAQMAATLDHISAGRAEIGLGAGWNHNEAKALGVVLGSPSERSDRLEETCEIMLRLFKAEDALTYEGRFFRLSDAWLGVQPVQRPHPPIWIGGNGRNRTLRTAARYAQHWTAEETSPDNYLSLTNCLARHCFSTGRDIGDMQVSMEIKYGDDLNLLLEKVLLFDSLGLDMIVISFPPPFNVDDLCRVAAALHANYA